MAREFPETVFVAYKCDVVKLVGPCSQNQSGHEHEFQQKTIKLEKCSFENPRQIEFWETRNIIITIINTCNHNMDHLSC